MASFLMPVRHVITQSSAAIDKINRNTKCYHDVFPSTNNSAQVDPAPGIWYVHDIPESNHISIVPVWAGTVRQKQFWRSMQDFLVSIDDCRALRGRTSRDITVVS